MYVLADVVLELATITITENENITSPYVQQKSWKSDSRLKQTKYSLQTVRFSLSVQGKKGLQIPASLVLPQLPTV